MTNRRYNHKRTNTNKNMFETQKLVWCRNRTRDLEHRVQYVNISAVEATDNNERIFNVMNRNDKLTQNTLSYTRFQQMHYSIQS